MSSDETAILAQFREFLATRSLRMTKERESLVREILRAPRHFEAEQLIQRLRRSRRRVSRATVYRTLMLLEECGILRKSTFGHDRSFYEAVLNEGHHDHLICLSCGSIEEFQSPQIEANQTRICQDRGFELIDHVHEMYGLCPKCLIKSESQAQA
ncbi:MAG: transcriptional repressor [Candidatus Eisenbacteria bacterium]|uniref:Transcriptional repressor n=1 Tax=Eiseniibacteriota bacterium TaxID=2212470 RepID=A0A948RY20_UNCEI|nr:transcriptional repressor [Candidatus Eisenbacteria bacterium]MBU1949525.1 transcriptional repressor [Candidatus Eisenbacteria bacterium]MBU2692556.1 transcriptional repressor [Candidatus Eisenbacteria bacterium]